MDKNMKAVIVVLAVVISILGGVIAMQMILPQTEPALNESQPNEPNMSHSQANLTHNGNNTSKPIQNTTNTTKKQNNPSVKVSPSEAKAIAQSVIEEPNSYAGTPKLVHEAEGYTYYVPVITNGTVGGEIFVDAQTGEVLGGTA